MTHPTPPKTNCRLAPRPRRLKPQSWSRGCQWSLASGLSSQSHTCTRHTAPRARPLPRPGGKEMRRWDSKGGATNTKFFLHRVRDWHTKHKTITCAQVLNGVPATLNSATVCEVIMRASPPAGRAVAPCCSTRWCLLGITGSSSAALFPSWSVCLPTTTVCLDRYSIADPSQRVASTGSLYPLTMHLL